MKSVLLIFSSVINVISIMRMIKVYNLNCYYVIVCLLISWLSCKFLLVNYFEIRLNILL